MLEWVQLDVTIFGTKRSIYLLNADDPLSAITKRRELSTDSTSSKLKQENQVWAKSNHSVCYVILSCMQNDLWGFEHLYHCKSAKDRGMHPKSNLKWPL